MSDYPETIELQRDSEEYKFLTKHSGLIKELIDFDEEKIELTADLLFNGDKRKWQNFVDIFFPELGFKKYFGYKNGKIYVLDERGTKEELREMLDFLLVDTPQTMMNFARKQAKKHASAPSNLNTVPRGTGAPRAQSAAAAVGNNGNNYGYNFENNNDEFGNNFGPENNNDAGVQLGQREEDEPYLARLRPQNRARFVNERRRRSNRRTRRNKSRRNKNRRMTRK